MADWVPGRITAPMLLVLCLRFLEGLVWARRVGDSKIRKGREEAE